MAERTINVQYKLRGDTLEKLQSKNAVYAEREPVIVIISAEDGKKTFMLKIGDGTTNFNDLPYATALAGDVAEWAKATNKPAYTASEISGIDTYIAEYITGDMGISVDTDTQYTIVPVDGNAYQYKLMSKSKDDSQYTVEVATITIPKYDDAALTDRIDDLEELVGDTSIAEQIADYIENLKLGENYETKGAAAAVQGDTDSTVEDVEDALDNYKTENDAAVATAKKAGEDAKSAVDTLAGKVGEVPAEKTVVQMISEAQTAATYDDTQVKADIKTNTDAITKLNDNAEVAGSVDYKIAQAVAAIMENPDETMNSINELVTWINSHAQDALELSNKVTANEQDIEALETLVGETAVATQITDAIAVALKIEGVDKYALATDLTSAIARIVALENVGATKVEKSNTNGNVKIDGVETEVYKLPDTVLDSGDTFVFDGGNA